MKLLRGSLNLKMIVCLWHGWRPATAYLPLFFEKLS